MTTTVKVHVNGNYRATVKQTLDDGTKREDIIIDGDQEGGRETSFSLSHPAHSTFEIVEEELTDEMKQHRQ